MTTTSRRAILAGAISTTAAAALPADALSAVPAGDRALLEAEREINERFAAMLKWRTENPDVDEPDEMFEGDYKRIFALDEIIETTPAIGLVGVVVKLRRLLDCAIGLDTGPTENCTDSVRHIYDVIAPMVATEGAPLGPPRPLYPASTRSDYPDGGEA